MDISTFIPMIAFGLDLALGDPQGWPHPVRWIGWLAGRLEGAGRLLGAGGPSKAFGTGAALALLVLVVLGYGLATFLPVLGWFAALYLAYAGLALGCLLKEGRRVAALLDAGELEQARSALALLVSRETEALDEEGCRRTLAETLSENFNDGFVAPFFWLCLTGPLGLWLYKTVSTLDSMWGYRTEEYKNLGWFAAKADDLLAWIPARISFVVLVFCGGLLGLDWRAALRGAPADARTMESPNAGWPMAAAAWLCDAGMGGEAVYFGKPKHKPELGPTGRAWTTLTLQALQRLLLWSAVFFALLGQLLIVVV
ncbi:MAG: adenosylcobinamide-phosphate synthase CbiB [Desulfovibrio sp.]